MDQKEYIDHIERKYAENIKIVRAKSHDYAASHDPFANFRLCQVLGLCSVETGIMVRLTDKISRISNLINFYPAVKDETINDTISDAQNYLGILDAWLEDQKQRDLEEEDRRNRWEAAGFPCNSRYAAERGDGEGI